MQRIHGKFLALATLLSLLVAYGCGGGGGGSGGGGTTFQPHANDTGIDLCGNATINNLACPASGYPDQDGDLGRDANATTNDSSDGRLGFSFTKLDASGNDLPASATSWSCVRDEVTGLTWETKTNDKGLHEGTAVYAWGPNGTTSSLCYMLTTCDADTFTAAVNSEALCGYSDWRLPRIEELQSLVDYSVAPTGPTIDTTYFPNSVNGSNVGQNYWSSGTRADITSTAWFMSFSDAGIHGTGKTSYLGVRVVHGGTAPGGTTTAQAGQTCDTSIPATAPDARYTDGGDGTVTDTQTGLMWARCPAGYTFSDNATPTDLTDDSCTAVPPYTFDWQTALSIPSTINSGGGYAGYTDWRMPNNKELFSLKETQCTGITLNNTIFPFTPGGINAAWSSTPDISNGTQAWGYALDYGYLFSSGKTFTGNVFLVRDAL